MYSVPLAGMLAHISIEVGFVESHHPEHQRHWLHESVLLAAYLVGRSGACRHVPIARTVDNGAGPYDYRPRLGLEDDALHGLVADYAAGEGMEEKLHARLVQHLQHHQLEDLRVEGYD